MLVQISYSGKSTAPGSLAIWTHHLKNLRFVDWDDAEYRGKAIKMGAGVEAREALSFAATHSRTVITGTCPTVGIAGGYIQGGGHSPLSSKYGLAADHALEFEVIDARGNYLVANQNQNADLFWALRGGGGGTFGVVLSVTVATFPDEPTTAMTLSFNSTGLSPETYFSLVTSFHETTLSFTAAECSALWTFDAASFSMTPMTCPGKTADETEALVQPFISRLDVNGVKYHRQILPFPTYHEYHTAVWSSYERGSAGSMVGGSWFVPRTTLEDPVGREDFTAVAQKLLDNGAFFLMLAWQMKNPAAGLKATSATPRWREMLIDVVVGL